MRALVMVLVAACGGTGSPADDAPPDTAAPPDGFTPTESRRLGVNDVSLLLPLAEDFTIHTTLVRLTGFPGGGELVPRAVFDHLVAPGDVQKVYGDFHAVAVRFDVCERVAPGPCPLGVDGQVRIVFQPLFLPNQVGAEDVALHAFYPIPAADMAPVVDELRALARLQNFQIESPLAINPTLHAGTTSEYATRLAALVGKYAVADRLQRLTLFAVDANARPFDWVFRGMERVGTDFEDMIIPTIASTQQRTIAGGNDFPTTPVADTPAGFQVMLQQPLLDQLSIAERKAALVALAEAQNPMKHTLHTEQCAACHVTTYLTKHRAQDLGVDPTTIANTYTSTHDLSLPPSPQDDPTSLRAFGWHVSSPSISQRVANESALVVDEMEQRFPPAP